MDRLTAIQDIIRDAGLSGLLDENVVIRKLPWVRGATLPCVIISPINETWKWANNQQLEIGYGVHVAVVQGSNQDLTTNHDRVLYWRQQITDAIVADQLSAVSDVINVTIEPSGLILPAAFRKQYDASAFVARCTSRETVSA